MKEIRDGGKIENYVHTEIIKKNLAKSKREKKNKGGEERG
jgi:hypothetical protein